MESADMIEKKICMLGSFAVGKTSLVTRFVTSIFSDKYLTTLGVKIDKKIVPLDGHDTSLIVWDIHGDDEFQRIRTSYLRGASGYLLVVDGTRRDTLDTAMGLRDIVLQTLGDVPFVLIFNKADLTDAWEIDQTTMVSYSHRGWSVISTSAKTGQGVEEAFVTLAQRL
jgi:small GTP-binding protein